MEDFVPKTPESKALLILDDYEGSNNYILNLKHKKQNSKSFVPTRPQADYINNYHTLQPKVAKKWVKLDSYFGKKLMEDKMYTKEPSEIYVEKLLVEKDKAYHIWGKIFSGETLHDFWMPKSALLKDNEVKNISIDYEKYTHRPPMEHQKEAIEKLVKNKKFILADDMGLGKTTSTIIAALETGAKKVLIVCPASLKINWEREIANYSDRTVYIAEGKKFSDEHDFVIVNYDILKNFHDAKETEKSEIMKINFVQTIIAIALSLLIAYGLFSFNKTENNVLLCVGSFVIIAVTLIITIGVSFELPRTTTNIKVVSAFFFAIALITNLIFTFISFSVPIYIITNGIFLLIFILISYSINKSKQ